MIFQNINSKIGSVRKFSLQFSYYFSFRCLYAGISSFELLLKVKYHHFAHEILRHFVIFRIWKYAKLWWDFPWFLPPASRKTSSGHSSSTFFSSILTTYLLLTLHSSNLLFSFQSTLIQFNQFHMLRPLFINPNSSKDLWKYLS